jgi:hypothetical protein
MSGLAFSNVANIYIFTILSKSRYNQRSHGQSVLMSGPIWGLGPDSCYCQTVAVLSMWGTLTDERMGMSFAVVKISSTCHLYLQFYMSAFCVVVCQKSPIPCGYIVSQSYFTTGDLPPVIYLSWCQAPWGSWAVILFFNWTLAVIVHM